MASTHDASDRLTLRYAFSVGTGERTADLSDPFLAPLRRAIRTGKPTGQWTHVFIDGSDAITRLLCSIALTDHGRLLFFPGAQLALTLPREVDTRQLGGKKRGEIENARRAGLDDARVEHITLDAPFSGGKTHIALGRVTGSQPRTLSRQTRARSGYLVPWLSYLFPQLETLTPLPRVLVVHFDARRPDTRRYAEHVLGNSIRPVRVAAPPPVGAPSFVQVDLWAGDWPGWQRHRTHGIGWAFDSEIARQVHSGDQTLRSHSIDVAFGNAGVRVVVTRPVGSLIGVGEGEPARLMRLPDLEWIGRRRSE